MPPTYATRPSITAIFSWWQCIGRSFASTGHPDACPVHELVARLGYLAAGRLEERQRRAGPREDADVGALGGVGEQLAQRRPAA
jgi:hypothetical protein